MKQLKFFTKLFFILFSPLVWAGTYYASVTKLVIGWIMIAIPITLAGAFYWAKKLDENGDREFTPYTMSTEDYIWIVVMTCLFIGGISIVVG